MYNKGEKMKKEITLDEIFRQLRGESTVLFYQPSTNTVGNAATFYEPKGKRLTEEECEEIGNSLMFINGLKHEEHKEIMSSFVHNFIDDKEQRKKLFDALRHRTDFYSRFEDACKNYGIYEDYMNFSKDIYIDIARDWYEKHVKNDLV